VFQAHQRLRCQQFGFDRFCQQAGFAQNVFIGGITHLQRRIDDLWHAQQALGDTHQRDRVLVQVGLNKCDGVRILGHEGIKKVLEFLYTLSIISPKLNCTSPP
jgi:hypothetical protein